MRRIAGLMAYAIAVALVLTTHPNSAFALPVNSNGLVITSATLEVKSVSAPSTWVPALTVYEGSPARLVLEVDAPSSGVARAQVSLPGVTELVGDTSTSISQGMTTITVPLDLSYGAWLAGVIQNTADRLNVNIGYTPTPAPPPPSPSPSISSESAPTTVTNVASSSESITVASTSPVRMVKIGASRSDRRSIRAAVRDLPKVGEAVAVLRPSALRAANCVPTRELRNILTAVADSHGRTVVIRSGKPMKKGCAQIVFWSSITPRSGLLMPRTTSTLTVPIIMAPRPLILVHGMWSSADTWTEYTRTGNLLVGSHSRWRGYAVSTMNTGSPWTPYAAVNTITQNAALAWTYINDRMSELNAHEVDIAAHSLGGVIVRRMLHDPINGEAARAATRSVVLLGTPNGGSSCSTAWAVPANAELTYTAMDTFNLAYPGYPGAFTTSLYSDNYSSTCFDSNIGDMFVPSWSTQAQSVNVAQRINPGVAHANMTGDARVFTDYLRPALTLVAAQPSAGPTTPLTNPTATSTLLVEGTATGSTLAVTETVTINPGQSLVASVVADDGASGSLQYTGASGIVTVPLSQVGGYPIFEAVVSYASLGGTSGALTIPVSINATTAAVSPQWRWSLVSRNSS